MEFRCFFCGNQVGAECFCWGCWHYICDDCMNHKDPPVGKHDVEEHRKKKRTDFYSIYQREKSKRGETHIIIDE